VLLTGQYNNSAAKAIGSFNFADSESLTLSQLQSALQTYGADGQPVVLGSANGGDIVGSAAGETIVARVAITT